MSKSILETNLRSFRSKLMDSELYLYMNGHTYEHYANDKLGKWVKSVKNNKIFQ